MLNESRPARSQRSTSRRRSSPCAKHLSMRRLIPEATPIRTAAAVWVDDDGAAWARAIRIRAAEGDGQLQRQRLQEKNSRSSSRTIRQSKITSPPSDSTFSGLEI